MHPSLCSQLYMHWFKKKIWLGKSLYFQFLQLHSCSDCFCFLARRMHHRLCNAKLNILKLIFCSLSPIFPLPSSEDVCKHGFTVIVDMRGSKWDSIKPLLKVLQESFPCCIHIALIIKPDNFWQKQRTNFGSSKFEFEVRSSFSLLLVGLCCWR